MSIGIDSFALRLVCKRHNAILAPSKHLDITRNLKKQHEALAPGTASLLDGMHRSRIYLTGSFVVQSLFGGTQCAWKAQDLDLLTQTGVDDADGFASAAVHTIENHVAPFPVSVICVGKESGRNMTDAYCAKTYSYKSLDDFVAREADFAFCRVLFDGERVRIHDLAAMWARSDKISAHHFHRLPYYQFGDDGQEIVKQMMARVEKYNARGFHIQHDVPPDQEARKQLNARLLRERDIELTGFDYEAVPWCVADPLRILRGLPTYEVDAMRANVRANVRAHEQSRADVPEEMRIIHDEYDEPDNFGDE